MNNNLPNIKDDSRILECKDLRISFKTNNGTVKAVRGISFDLYRGRTLAIVGESGSGKSVTSKAIMGLLAGNKIIEDGHIFFDGHDILKLSEREMSDIRGSRISMIFQDPMTSLNPIMRVGNQMTEVLVLKNQAVRATASSFVRKATNVILFGGFKLYPNEKKKVFRIIQSIKSVDEQLNSEDNAFAVELINAIIDVELTKYLAEVEKTKVITDDLIAKHLSDGLESFDFAAFVKDSALLKNIKKKVNNPFSLHKDDLSYTGYETTKQYLKKFKETVKAEEKAKVAKEKQVASGKEEKPLTEKQRIHNLSWGSEYIQTSLDIFEQIKALFEEYSEHLAEILATQEQLRAETKAEGVIENIRTAVVDKKAKISKKEAKQKAIHILEEVGIADADKRFRQYPFELSGGMRQRIVIAIALLSNPDILICDEPTTALDVTIQAQILDLINKIKYERNLSIIFVTHNLGVVANMADDVAVMYAGKIVEFGEVNDIFYNPKHPYTWALLASMPDLNTKDRLESIPGTPPNMIIPPKGDAFAARNKYALNIDFEEEPPLFKISEGHYAATWLLHEDAPKVTPPRAVLTRMKQMQDYLASLDKNNNGGSENVG